MQSINKTILFAFLFLWSSTRPAAQSCGGITVQEVADTPSICNEMTMTMLHDQLDRPFLYIANKEAGLKIMDISNLSLIAEAASIPVTDLNGLEVMSLTQSGEYIYLALGNHFVNPQLSGMAVIGVADPTDPVLLSVWDSSDLLGGAGIVVVEGNTAYLGAMGNGLMIFDVTDKNNIILLSQFVPDILYPDPNPDPAKFNARGMAVKNGIVLFMLRCGRPADH